MAYGPIKQRIHNLIARLHNEHKMILHHDPLGLDPKLEMTFTREEVAGLLRPIVKELEKIEELF